jgi:hypothetical protein
MEGVLDNRLKCIGLHPDTNVTAGVEIDCLFSAYSSAVTSRLVTADLDSMPRGMVKVSTRGEDGAKVEVREFTWSYVVHDKKKYHVHTVQGLRELCGDAAHQLTDELNMHPARDRIMKHIKHRFAKAEWCERDQALTGVEPLPEDATDSETVDAWGANIRLGGVFRPCLKEVLQSVVLRAALTCTSWDSTLRGYISRPRYRDIIRYHKISYL